MKGFKKNPAGGFTAVHLKVIDSNFEDGLHSLEVKEGGYENEYIDDNAAHNLKLTPGILRRIYIWDAGTAWTIDIKDGATSLTGGAVAVAGLPSVLEFHTAMKTSIIIETASGAPAGKILATYD